jgi:hypothetical protein
VRTPHLAPPGLAAGGGPERVVIGRALLAELLDAAVGEVDEAVAEVFERVALDAEAREALPVHEGLQRVKGRDEDIEPQVELVTVEEVRVPDVPLRHHLPGRPPTPPRLSASPRHKHKERGRGLASMVGDGSAAVRLTDQKKIIFIFIYLFIVYRVAVGELGQVVEEVDAAAAREAHRLDDPDAGLARLALVGRVGGHELGVLLREGEALGHDVEEVRLTAAAATARGRPELRQRHEALEVALEEVLARELAGVGEVVHALERQQRRVVDVRLAPCPEQVPRRLEPQVAGQLHPLGHPAQHVRHDVVHLQSPRITTTVRTSHWTTKGLADRVISSII